MRMVGTKSGISVLLFTLLLGRLSFAVAQTTTDFHVTNWRTGEGLPQNSVLSIAQTDDGFLWLGTFNGLARFDGKSFTVFNAVNTPAFESDLAIPLDVGREGKLWIENGEEVVCFQRGRFRRYEEPSRERTRAIRDLAEDRDGRVLIGSDGGFFLLDPEGAVTELDRDALHPEGAWTQTILDGRGQMWCSAHTALFKLVGTSLERVALFDEYIALLLLDPDGVLHCRIANGDVVKVEANGRLDRLIRGALQADVVLMDQPGRTWLVNEELWVERNGKAERIDLGDGQTGHRRMYRGLVDKENNVWVGSDGFGLYRLREKLLKAWSVDSGIGGRDVASVMEDREGRIWLGTYRGGYSVRAELGWTNSLPAVGESVMSLLQLRDGRIVRASDLNGLWYLEGAAWKRLEAVNARSVVALFEDRQERLWVGSRSQGLELIEDSATRSVDLGQESDGLRVSSFAEDESGEIWIGSNDGLFRWNNGMVVRYGRADGLGADAVHCLHHDGESLWIGTVGGGLSRWRNGRFASVDSRHGLMDDVVAQLQTDDQGHLWIGSNRGLFRVSKRDLNAALDGEVDRIRGRSFGIADGMRSLECGGGCQPNSLKDRSGRLWFSTVNGVVTVDPRKVGKNEVAPSVHIREVLADGRVVGAATNLGGMLGSGLPQRRDAAGGDTPVIRIPAGTRRVEIHYLGVSLADPEGVEFQYQLEGFDDAWIDAGGRRLASFTGLKPGRYRFGVRSVNSDGVQNPHPAVINLLFEPRYWVTLWFRAGGGAVVAALVGVGVRIRRRRRSEVEKLRQRIARDLHDELGANIGAISLLSGMGGQLDGPDESCRTFAEIGDLAQTTAAALRDVAWFVNPEFDTMGDLVSHLQVVAGRLLPDSKVRFEFDVENAAEKLGLQFRRSVCATYKEALHNAAKYSEAGMINVRVVSNRREFELQIEDNGRGFDPDHAAGGNGLQNMRARTAEIRGRLVLDAAEGRGTRVTLSLRRRRDA